MHERRAERGTAEAGGAERAVHGRHDRFRQAPIVAVAELSSHIERVNDRFCKPYDGPRVGFIDEDDGHRCRHQADVVKLLVREIGAGVAADALPTSDKDSGTSLLGLRKGAGVPVHPLVEAAGPAGDQPLVGTERLTQVHDNPRHGNLIGGSELIVLGVVARHSVLRAIAGRLRVDRGRLTTRQVRRELRETRGVVQRGHRPEDRFVVGAVKRIDLLGGIQARAVHLDRGLQRAERLIVERVVTTVPHEELCLPDVDERRRSAPTPTRCERNLLSKRAIVEVAGGRDMTARTRDFACLSLATEGVSPAVVVAVE